MNTYKHSVSLDVDKCTGCTTCLRHCPTEAIRIRGGHAVINEERCIDCGVCITMCPHKAKKATYSKLEAISKYKYKIALPAPTLYGQFEGLDDIDYVIQGLYDIGFDDVFEVAAAAELVSAYTRIYMKTEGINKPVISSACPGRYAPDRPALSLFERQYHADPAADGNRRGGGQTAREGCASRTLRRGYRRLLYIALSG